MAHPRRNDFLIPTLGVLFDGVAVECAFLFSYWIRFDTSFLKFLPVSEQVPPLDAYAYGSLVVIPIWLLIFNSRNMYGARRNVASADELLMIVRLVTLGMLVVMSAAFFYRAFSYSRVVFGLLWATSIAFMFVGRIILNNIERNLYRSGRELRNAVIIGINETANRIYNSLHNHPLLGYRIIGYFADVKSAQSDGLGLSTYLGSLETVPSQLHQENVELALVSLNHDEHDKLYRLVYECEGLNVDFMMVPDILEIMASPNSVGLKEIEGIPFIKIKGVPMTTWGRIAKRLFDFLISSILLIVLSPVLIIAAVFIKLDSQGSVFFKQERVGMDGKQFEILKFRSMRVGAEKETGPVWAKDGDPRRTEVGKFLRKTSLDEFPQLINVLRGEMSLVGPRPERQFFVEQFSQRDTSGKALVPKYLDRHRVKTGMTGWAQVNGLRGNTSLEERIKYDIYYIENWSLGFDIKILFKTLRALFSTGNVH